MNVITCVLYYYQVVLASTGMCESSVLVQQQGASSSQFDSSPELPGGNFRPHIIITIFRPHPAPDTHQQPQLALLHRSYLLR
jgi:hypothetical protein